jgi:phosphoacetylglucosamine mutase
MCPQVLGWTLEDWLAMYSDLCSRQTKVPATNKSLIVCSEDETRVVEPAALQSDLDAAMSSIPLGRCFVRPSGTEDYVRIYAEAQTQADADRLALLCIDAIQTHIGITGEVPRAFN